LRVYGKKRGPKKKKKNKKKNNNVEGPKRGSRKDSVHSTARNEKGEKRRVLARGTQGTIIRAGDPGPWRKWTTWGKGKELAPYSLTRS